MVVRELPARPKVRTQPPRQASDASVAIVHDYLTQRGGAERVVLAMAEAFPRAPIYTSIYEPSTTFREFDATRVRASALSRSQFLRRDHRRALPFLASAFSHLRVDADTVICSSSGWSHAARTDGRKIVYCHSPARWLYQPERYLRTAGPVAAAAGRALRAPLIRWDRRNAANADEYVVVSRAIRDRVRTIYGIDARVLHPPLTVDPTAPQRAVEGLQSGFWLTVARLLPYKNVDAIVAAFEHMPHRRLVVVGQGPEERRLRQAAPSNVRFLGGVDDDQLRWLYANCLATVAASHEDFGLTPLEAAAFGKATVAIRFGGYLDTIVDGETGVLVDGPSPASLAEGIARLETNLPDPEALRRHAVRFDRKAFIARLRGIVAA